MEIIKKRRNNNNYYILLINFLILMHIMTIIKCSLIPSNMIKLINDFNDFNENETDNNTINLEILYENVTKGIESFINNNVLENSNFNETDCYKYLKNINNEDNQKNIKSMIQYSNFKISTDVSDEIDCINSGLNYSLLSYRIKNTSYIKERKKNILNFLNFRITFTTGICLVKECLNILEDNFNEKDENGFGYKLNNKSKLYKYLSNTIYMPSLSLFKHYDKNHIQDSNNRYSKNNGIFIVIVVTFFLIIFVRIIISVYTNIKIIYVNKKEIKKAYKNAMNPDLNESQKTTDSENLFLYTKKYQKKANEIKEDSLIEEKYKHFLDFISIYKNISALGETKNYMFDNTNLEIPYGFQGISLFFFVLVHTFNNYISYPSVDYFNTNMFNNLRISIIKFAQFSSYFYLSLNGFIYSFKFLSYYKKYIHNKLSKKYSLVVLYLLTFIPKFIMFILSSFIFHSYSINILDLINSYLYQNEFKQKLKPKDCLKKTYNYILFFSSYLADDTKEGFINCYNYMYSFVNELYSVIVFIILFCILLKCRSKILDIIFIILVILNFIFNFAFFKIKSEYKINETNYDFTSFLGEKISIKYFHIYLNIFFYGAFAGIIHFYNLDIISKDRVNNFSYSANNYFPFSFLDCISHFLSNLSKFKRILLIIFDMAILGLLSSVYLIENFSKKESIFKLDFFLSIIHIYENHIATIFFISIILLFCTMEKDSATIQFFKSWPFIFVSRVGYFFYSIAETTILIFFIITNYQTYLDMTDLLFLNFGQFIFGTLISTIFVIIIEIPMRYFMKKLRKHIENKIINGDDTSILVKKKQKTDELKLELKSLDGDNINNNEENLINNNLLS